jgi:hypothetical protein
MKYIYCFLFLLQISFAIGQEPCNFHLNTERVQYIRDVLGQQTNKNYNGQMPMVRLALHNIRKDDGTGGYNWIDIETIVGGLTFFYEPHDICFTVISEDNIDETKYYNLRNLDGNRWEDLITKDHVQGAINIYFIKGVSIGAKSTGFVTGSNISTVTLTLDFGRIFSATNLH